MSVELKAHESKKALCARKLEEFGSLSRGEIEHVCVDKGEPNDGRISIFKSIDHPFGRQKSRDLNDVEYNAAHY